MGLRSWLTIPATMILTMCLVACSGATPAESVPGDPDTPAPGTGSSESPVPGAGSSDAPVTATIDGVTFPFPVGTCEVTEDVVRASAGPPEGEFGGLDVTWRRDGSDERIQVANSGLVSEPPAPFELYADPSRGETEWEVRVEGTTATIEARMANELPAAQDDPDLAFFDVTIRIDCDEPGFGGMAPEPTEAAAPTAEPEPTTAATEATVSVSIDGTTYTFPYLGCPMEEPTISLILLDADANRLLVSAGQAVLALPDGTSYRSEGDVEFDVSGRAATWTGTMTTGTADADATIAITCGA